MKNDYVIEEILDYNRKFVSEEAYKPYQAANLPKKKLAIVTCMDARLTTLLPAALGLKNGDAKMIKVGGGVIDEPYGSVMQSLLVSIYALTVETVLIIGHRDCGARATNGQTLIKTMRARGISEENLQEAETHTHVADWLEGFHDLGTTVQKSVDLVTNHPLIPADIRVKGLIIDPNTGELTADLTITE